MGVGFDWKIDCLRGLRYFHPMPEPSRFLKGRLLLRLLEGDSRFQWAYRSRKPGLRRGWIADVSGSLSGQQ